MHQMYSKITNEFSKISKWCIVHDDISFIGHEWCESISSLITIIKMRKYDIHIEKYFDDDMTILNIFKDKEDIVLGYSDTTEECLFKIELTMKEIFDPITIPCQQCGENFNTYINTETGDMNERFCSDECAYKSCGVDYIGPEYRHNIELANNLMERWKASGLLEGLTENTDTISVKLFVSDDTQQIPYDLPISVKLLKDEKVSEAIGIQF